MSRHFFDTFTVYVTEKSVIFGKQLRLKTIDASPINVYAQRS